MSHSTAPITWTPKMLAYLREHYAECTNNDIAQALGVSRQSVFRKALDLGLERKGNAARQETRERISQAQEAHLAQERRREAAGLVACALANRTPIEVAVQGWRCAA